MSSTFPIQVLETTLSMETYLQEQKLDLHAVLGGRSQQVTNI